MTRARAGELAGRFGPYAVAAVLLLADFLLVARGLGHAQAGDGGGYAVWALDHGSYSDVVKLSIDHYLHAGGIVHPLPYVHDRIEYPVLLGFLLWLPSWLPGGPASWLAVAGVMTAAATFGSIALLRRISAVSVWWIAASPALLLDAAINWDLIGIVFLVAAVVSFAEGRHRISGAAAAVGTWVKLFPVVVAPMALAALGSRWWRDVPGRRAARRAWWGWAVPFVVVSAVVAVPFLLVASSNTLWFFRYNSTRGEKDSLFGLLGKIVGPWAASSHFANTASLLVVLAAVGVGAWSVWRLADGDQARGVALATAISLCAWMAVNKVWNPQYLLWVFAAGGIAAAPAPLLVALGAVTVWDNWFEFVLRIPDHTNPYSAIGDVSVVARTVVFACLAGWCGLQLHRLFVSRRHPRTEVSPAPTPA